MTLRRADEHVDVPAVALPPPVAAARLRNKIHTVRMYVRYAKGEQKSRPSATDRRCVPSKPDTTRQRQSAATKAFFSWFPWSFLALEPLPSATTPRMLHVAVDCKLTWQMTPGQMLWASLVTTASISAASDRGMRWTMSSCLRADNNAHTHKHAGKTSQSLANFRWSPGHHGRTITTTPKKRTALNPSAHAHKHTRTHTC